MPEDSIAQRQDTRDGMARNAVLMSAMTMVSRVTGLAREMVFAAILGATDAASAYAVAITLPNRLRQIFAEGAMAAAFVPMLAEAAKQSPERVWVFVRRFLWTLAACVATVVLLAILGAPVLTRIFAPGFVGRPDLFGLTTLLTRIIFVYLLLVSLSALLGSVLNYFGAFGIPALAPALFNTVTILFAYGMAVTALRAKPVFAFAFAWLVAGMVQVIVQVPKAVRLGMSFRPEIVLSDPLVMTSAALLAPRLIGYAAHMVNEIVAQRAATSLVVSHGIQAPIYLFQAMRLNEFVLGGFVTSVSTVILPTLSRQIAGDLKSSYVATVNGSLRVVAFITIPAAAALEVIGIPVIGTLLQRGRWNAEDTAQTAYALSMYVTALFAFGAIRVLIPAFYAQKDTWTPLLVAVSTVVVNAILIQLLVGPLRHGGIALSLALSAYLQLGLLLVLLRRRLGPLGLASLVASIARIALASGVMAAALAFIEAFLPSPGPGELPRIAHLAALVATGAGAYFAACWLVRCRELREAWEVVGPRLRRLRGRVS